MRHSHPSQHRDRLLPEGRRWGFGAHSVVPYLTNMRRDAAPESAPDIRNPVFTQMEQALRSLRQQH